LDAYKRDIKLGKILITGATGLIGQQLGKNLIADGEEVVGLSRKENLDTEIPLYQWNIKKEHIDERALNGVKTIIHLAGAPIADEYWTYKRKEVLYDSRIKATNLLADTIMKNDLPVKNFISASAIGIYGNRGEEWLCEESSTEKNWLARLCKDWEASVDPLTEWGLRTACIRIGIVLAKNGGALDKMLPPIKKGINPVLGGGKQYYSWIHIDDLTGIFKYLINHPELFGVYNAVAPNPVRFKTFIESIENVLGKKTIKPPVPKFALRFAMGGMSKIVLDSARVSADKIIQKGYEFKYPDLDGAMQAIL